MEQLPRLRMVFMGTPAFTLPSLEELRKGEDELIGIVTQPDKPRGRGRKVTPPAAKIWAQGAGIPVHQPKTLKSPAFFDVLKELVPDLIVVEAYGKILPPNVLTLPPLGCVNLHASLLPKYRGAAPIQWALLNGDKEIGVTATFMTEELDAGDILVQKSMPIEPDAVLLSLENRLSILAAEVLMETIAGLKGGKLKGIPQCHEEATYAPKIKKEDGIIDWWGSALEIERKVRALNPWPGAWTKLGNKIMKILAARALEGVAGGQPGEIVALSRTGWQMACGQGGLLVTHVQLENRKGMAAYDLSLGHDIKIGNLLGNHP